MGHQIQQRSGRKIGFMALHMSDNPTQEEFGASKRCSETVASIGAFGAWARLLVRPVGPVVLSELR
jgi:hypothetical protein